MNSGQKESKIRPVRVYVDNKDNFRVIHTDFNKRCVIYF